MIVRLIFLSEYSTSVIALGQTGRPATAHANPFCRSSTQISLFTQFHRISIAIPYKTFLSLFFRFTVRLNSNKYAPSDRWLRFFSVMGLLYNSRPSIILWRRETEMRIPIISVTTILFRSAQRNYDGLRNDRHEGFLPQLQD